MCTHTHTRKRQPPRFIDSSCSSHKKQISVVSIVQPTGINLGTLTAPLQPPPSASVPINLQPGVAQSLSGRGLGGQRTSSVTVNAVEAARFSFLPAKRPPLKVSVAVFARYSDTPVGPAAPLMPIGV